MSKDMTFSIMITNKRKINISLLAQYLSIIQVKQIGTIRSEEQLYDKDNYMDIQNFKKNIFVCTQFLFCPNLKP